MKSERQPTAIGFIGLQRHSSVRAVCRPWTCVFGVKNRPKQLFDLREDAFHLVPAKGAKRMTLDVAE